MRLDYFNIIPKLLLLLMLNGCIQSTAFLGPAVTVASTGNIYQAGLSYGSNKAVQHVTGDSPVGNIKKMLKLKKDENKIVSSFKKKIEKNKKIQKLLNQ